MLEFFPRHTGTAWALIALLALTLLPGRIKGSPVFLPEAHFMPAQAAQAANLTTELAFFLRSRVAELLGGTYRQKNNARALRWLDQRGGMGNQLQGLAGAVIAAACTGRRLSVVPRSESSVAAWLWGDRGFFEHPLDGWRHQTLRPRSPPSRRAAPRPQGPTEQLLWQRRRLAAGRNRTAASENATESAAASGRRHTAANRTRGIELPRVQQERYQRSPRYHQQQKQHQHEQEQHQEQQERHQQEQHRRRRHQQEQQRHQLHPPPQQNQQGRRRLGSGEKFSGWGAVEGVLSMGDFLAAHRDGELPNAVTRATTLVVQAHHTDLSNALRIDPKVHKWLFTCLAQPDARRARRSASASAAAAPPAAAAASTASTKAADVAVAASGAAAAAAGALAAERAAVAAVWRRFPFSKVSKLPQLDWPLAHALGALAWRPRPALAEAAARATANWGAFDKRTARALQVRACLDCGWSMSDAQVQRTALCDMALLTQTIAPTMQHSALLPVLLPEGFLEGHGLQSPFKVLPGRQLLAKTGTTKNFYASEVGGGRGRALSTRSAQRPPPDESPPSSAELALRSVLSAVVHWTIGSSGHVPASVVPRSPNAMAPRHSPRLARSKDAAVVVEGDAAAAEVAYASNGLGGGGDSLGMSTSVLGGVMVPASLVFVTTESDVAGRAMAAALARWHRVVSSSLPAVSKILNVSAGATAAASAALGVGPFTFVHSSAIAADLVAASPSATAPAALSAAAAASAAPAALSAAAAASAANPKAEGAFTSTDQSSVRPQARPPHAAFAPQLGALPEDGAFAARLGPVLDWWLLGEFDHVASCGTTYSVTAVGRRVQLPRSVVLHEHHSPQAFLSVGGSGNKGRVVRSTNRRRLLLFNRTAPAASTRGSASQPLSAVAAREQQKRRQLRGKLLVRSQSDRGQSNEAGATKDSAEKARRHDAQPKTAAFHPDGNVMALFPRGWRGCMSVEVLGRRWLETASPQKLATRAPVASRREESLEQASERHGEATALLAAEEVAVQGPDGGGVAALGDKAGAGRRAGRSRPSHFKPTRRRRPRPSSVEELSEG